MIQRIDKSIASAVLPKLLEQGTPFVLITLDRETGEEDEFFYSIRFSGDIFVDEDNDPDVQIISHLIRAAADRIEGNGEVNDI
jgi:hypothetical protein